MSSSSFRATQKQQYPPDEKDWFCQGCIKKYDCGEYCKELKRFLSRNETRRQMT